MFGKKKIKGYETYGEKEKKKEILKSRLKKIGGGLSKLGKIIVPPKTPEQIAFEKQLKEETIKARREAYLKSAIKESKIRGEQLAKNKFNPERKQKQDNDLMDRLMKL